jgi:L-fuculose-phosphate aldolase
MTEFELRGEIVAAARGLLDRRLTSGRSGNVSARWRDGILITPSGMDYRALEPGDVVPLGPDGAPRGSPRAPSTEWRMHAGLYAARPEVEAIVHAHPVYATALACTGREIPAFHYMVAVAGGDSIPLAPYATFGTEEIARAALTALAGRRACLLAHHGALALGAAPARALDLMEEVEWLAHQYWAALAAGNPGLLTAGEMERVRERFRSYGQPARR